MTLTPEQVQNTPWGTKTKTQWAAELGVSYATFHQFTKKNPTIKCLNTCASVKDRGLVVVDGKQIAINSIRWADKTAAEWSAELKSTDTTVRKWATAMNQRCKDGRVARFKTITDEQISGFDWTLPDVTIAKSVGVSKSRIATLRKRLNMPASTTRPTALTRRFPDLKPDVIPTMSLREFCEKYKCASGTATRFVKQYSTETAPLAFKPTIRKSKYDWSAVDWSASNADLATKLGCTRVLVASRRRKFSPETVTNSRSRRGNIEWKNIDWVNKSNEQIAAETSYLRAWVGQMRLRHAPGSGPKIVRKRAAVAADGATPVVSQPESAAPMSSEVVATPVAV